MEILFDTRFSVSLMSWVIVIPMLISFIFPYFYKKEQVHSVLLGSTATVFVLLLLMSILTLFPFFGGAASDLSLMSSWFASEASHIELAFGVVANPAWGLFTGLSLFFGLMVLYLIHWKSVSPIWILFSLFMSISSVGLVWASSSLWTLVLAQFLSIISVLILLATAFSLESAFILIQKIVSFQIFGIFLILLGGIVSAAGGNPLFFGVSSDLVPLSPFASFLIWLGVVMQLGTPLVVSKVPTADAKISEGVKAVLSVFPSLVSAGAIWKVSPYLEFPNSIRLTIGAFVFLFNFWVLISEWRNKNWSLVWFFCNSLCALYVGVWSASVSVMFFVISGFGFFTLELLPRVKHVQTLRWVRLILAWILMGGPLGMVWASLLRASSQLGDGGVDLSSYIFLEIAFLVQSIALGVHLFDEQGLDKNQREEWTTGAVYWVILNLLLLLSFPWTGTFLGGFPSSLDIAPWIETWFVKEGRLSIFQRFGETSLNQVVLLVIHGTFFLLSVIFARWISIKKRTQLAGISVWAVQKNLFFYSIVANLSRIERILEHAVRFSEKLFWGVYLPRQLRRVAGSASRLSLRASSGFEKFSDQALSKSTRLPGKAFQLLQNGNVHWYISITVISVVLLFYKFSKSIF